MNLSHVEKLIKKITSKQEFTIEPKYADDTTRATHQKMW